MLVTRTSKLSGIIRTLDLDITQQQLLDYERGMKIQHAFPNLTPADREFFMTGITDEEWKEMFENRLDEDDHGYPDEPDLGNSYFKEEGNYFDEN